MYSRHHGLVLGFHGCDLAVRDKVVTGQSPLAASKNKYDWLGHGMYFWEHNPERAIEYAQLLKRHPERSAHPIENPSVLGAVIDLGYCLDLLESKSLRVLTSAYQYFVNVQNSSGFKIPRNRTIKNESDVLIRELDCAVIETVHNLNDENNDRHYDSVRGVFVEGEELYDNAGFHDKNHIQICVRNPNCIKGFFIPRKVDDQWIVP